MPGKDVGILNSALGAELESIAAYQVGAESGLLQKPVLDLAVQFQGHHKEHAALLASVVSKLGGKPVIAKAQYAFPLDTLKSQADVLRFAAMLEKGAVSAYLGAVPLFGDRELAKAAQVTESYISQLLTRRRMPPAPNRTDIYEKMDKVLKLPRGELAKLAGHQRKEQLKKELGDEPAPLFAEVRELILRKCLPARERAVRAIFEREPFGDLERLVTKTILDLVKGIARKQLDNEHWLRNVGGLAGRSFEDMRVVALEFLDTDILSLSPDNCVVFLDPLLQSWEIDLTTFEMEICLNPKVSPAVSARRFQFVERSATERDTPEPGFTQFMADGSLRGTATDIEVEFLRGLRFTTWHPTALYYYRELQSLRDPLHFTHADPSA